MLTLPTGINFFERGWLSSNNVLIHDDESALLIDSGYWTHAEQTYALVRSVLKDRPLTALCNTHLHSDHCGGNAYLQQKFPLLHTHIPPGHASYVDEWDAEKLTYVPTGQHCPKFTRTHALHDGDTFTVASKKWRVHAAPGHDPHSIVIFNEHDGILISADALWENGFGVVFPEIEGISAFNEVASTLDIIEHLDPKLVLPGHGSAFTDFKGALARARSRLTQFMSAQGKHAYYAAKVLLKFKLLELQKAELSEILGWAASTRYFKLLHARYASNASFENWMLDVCLGLEKSGACMIAHDQISNLD